jgi:hypothetical protein
MSGSPEQSQASPTDEFDKWLRAQPGCYHGSTCLLTDGEVDLMRWAWGAMREQEQPSA